MKRSMSPQRTQTRVALFGLGLATVFAAAFLLGSAFEPVETDAGESHGSAGHGGHDQRESTVTAASGLAVSEGGYTLRFASTFLGAGEERRPRFQIEGPDGEPVRDFDRLHEREMHLIVVRRDGAHFQHLHPELDASGTWSVALALPAAGTYRAFADFSVGGHDHTLAADLFASGPFAPRPLPAPSPLDRTAGYEVRLDGASPRAGQPSALRFLVSRNGREVTDLQRYLGARGHLVALREGDLAFLHVHPEEAAAPDAIPFTAHFPTPGRYRLYLQLKRGGEVSTAEFTVAVRR